ncbi:MAG: hypothetical protein M1438_16400 [Deltaproteobacteria bacterium]|nr:hypothetical protein [Deltaproteobacteria bacterium]
MDSAKDYPLKVMGLLNSIIHPLLSALISLDDLICKEFGEIETVGNLLQIDDQIQAAAEYFLELRTLTSIQIRSLQTMTRKYLETVS